MTYDCNQIFLHGYRFSFSSNFKLSFQPVVPLCQREPLLFKLIHFNDQITAQHLPVYVINKIIYMFHYDYILVFSYNLQVSNQWQKCGPFSLNHLSLSIGTNIHFPIFYNQNRRMSFYVKANSFSL